MNQVMANLKRWGAQPEEAVHRMVDDEEFYLKVLSGFYRRREWEQLCRNVDEMQFQAAFRVAHDLKGVTATLGLTPLFEAVSEIVEDLREEPVTEQSRERLIIDMEAFRELVNGFEEIMDTAEPVGDISCCVS